jgi:DNA polymerase-1
MPRLFLVDGTALAYRSHFALQRQGFTAPDGTAVGATWGFARTLHDLLDKEKPDRIAVAFDPPGPTFRHARYAPYKATREKMPDEIVAQLELLREVVRGLGIPVFEVANFEADDVIGTLAAQAEAAGWEVLIVTGDKDFLQLVNERVRLYNVFKPGVPLLVEGPAESVERLGVPPERVIDMLAIMGDSSDNVPGVKGIGEKGALKLLAQWGSVDGMLAHLDEIAGKAGEAVRRDKEQMLLSRELVTISRDVPLEPGFERIGPPKPDSKRLVRLYQRLGFNALLQRASAEVQSSEARDYRIVRDRAALESMLAELRAARRFALDTETTSLFPLQAELVGMSFSAKALAAWYVPFNLEPPLLEGGRAALVEALRPLLEDPTLERIGQNTKYDWLVLAHHGLRPPPPDFDTMVASFCAAGSARRHNLDDLALRFFDLQKIPTSALIGAGKSQTTMDKVPVEQVGEYACEDADVTFRLVEPLARELAENQAESLFRELEMPLVPVLAAL